MATIQKSKVLTITLELDSVLWDFLSGQVGVIDPTLEDNVDLVNIISEINKARTIKKQKLNYWDKQHLLKNLNVRCK